jgi:hypothetical protein
MGWCQELAMLLRTGDGVMALHMGRSGAPGASFDGGASQVQ